LKQLIYMIALCVTGTVGTAFEPFLSVFVYYHFAVLRPQFMWQWSLPPGVAWSNYVGWAGLIAAAACLLGVIPRRPRQAGEAEPLRTSPPVYAWMAAFGAWVVLTSLTAQNVEAAYPMLMENMKIFLMFGVSALLIHSFRHVQVLFLMAATTLAYISFEVNYAYFVNHSLSIWSNGFGGYDNNGAGLMLAMGVPLCYFAFEGLRRWWRWGFLLLVPVLIHSVLMTYSRGAMLSLLVASPLVYLRSRRKVLLAGIGLALGCILIPMMAGPQIRQRFLTIEKSDVDESANLRWQSWEAAWRMACDHPILGVGLKNADLLSYDYGTDRLGRTIHNQYLQVAADSGFVGAAFYVGLLISTWMALRRVRCAMAGRRDNEATQVHCMAAGLECSLTVFCIGAWFLSLETFELSYLLILLAAQLTRVPLPAPVAKQSTSADEAASPVASLPAPA
jgi:probable O-glycosylation ligase (exosortase A-associated)